MRSQSPSIAVVVPVYNEALSIGPFLAVVNRELPATQCSYRIMFVNDGSIDSTLEVLKRFKKDDPHISIASLSRNFGKEAALTAGLDIVDEQVVILVDVDLQDPLPLIHQFLEHWRQGYD